MYYYCCLLLFCIGMNKSIIYISVPNIQDCLPTFLHEYRLKCFFHYLFPLLLYLNQSTKKVADIGNKCDVDEEQNIRKEIVEYFTLE